MALHIYQTWIEYDNRPGYHPVNVYLKRGQHSDSETIAEYHGRSLSRGLAEVRAKLVEMEKEEA